MLGEAHCFDFLLQLDDDLAAEAQAAGCPCGGVLHSARYRRKPRGGPAGLGPAHAVRRSFCCAREGCRRRVTPPSVRFLGRKVYFSVMILLLPVLLEGPTPRRARQLEEELTVSPRTLRRWRRWWRESVAVSPWFAASRGRFARPVRGDQLPGSLLEAFSGVPGPEGRVLATLRWLLSLGSMGGGGPGGSGSVQASLDPQKMPLDAGVRGA